MRAALTIFGGLSLAAVAWFLSRQLDGLPGAVLFMLAILIVPVALGIGLASLFDPDLKPTNAAARRARFVFRRSRAADPSRCGRCGSKRQLQQQIWICAACDHAVVPDMT